MIKTFKNKIVVVTGGTGTIGSELVSQLLQFNPKQIRVFSRDETKQYDLLEKLGHPKNLRMLIGDIRDKERLELAFAEADIVIHAAAMKHVPFCEYNPFEVVKTNIVGSQNVINAALKNNVKKVIAISTDKAANPTNIMGASKLMMEKLFINTNDYQDLAPTVFSCVRFGNVSWARGSVLPLWNNQIKKDKTINVTDKEMTRFLMSIKEAGKLVLNAVKSSRAGEIFIFKMPSVKIMDLADFFIKKYHPNEDVKIKITGMRPGEKLHEFLATEDETSRMRDAGNMFIIEKESWRGSLGQSDRISAKSKNSFCYISSSSKFLVLPDKISESI
jgi:FlaA1/EpsC-like NDP-sugar epimerase